MSTATLHHTARTRRRRRTRPRSRARLTLPPHDLQEETGAWRFVYRNLFANNAVYVTSIVAAAIVANEVYSSTMDRLWASNNEGKLFDDVIGKFPEIPPGCEPDEDDDEEEGDGEGDDGDDDE